jgi:hypothetical protein
VAHPPDKVSSTSSHQKMVAAERRAELISVQGGAEMAVGGDIKRVSK